QADRIALREALGENFLAKARKAFEGRKARCNFPPAPFCGRRKRFEKHTLLQPAYLSRAALDAVHAEKQIDDPADERHKDDEADPASRCAFIRLGEKDMNGCARHAPELNEGKQEGPDIPKSRYHEAPYIPALADKTQ